MGKVRVEIGTYQALKSGKQIFYPLIIVVRFRQEKYYKLLNECCKMALFVMQFLEPSR